MRRVFVLAVVAVLASCGGSTNQPAPQPQPKTCNNLCPAKDVTRCGAAQVQACVADADGCLAWGTAKHCPGTQVCDTFNEKCIDAPCTSKCSAVGATQCSGTQIQTCQELEDGCRDWSLPVSCGGTHEECSAAQGRCVTVCTDLCPSNGATQCSGDQFQTCSTSAQGCREWGLVTPCPTGQKCDPSQNKCVDVCTIAVVASACAAAAQKNNDCCGGTLLPFTAEDLCHWFTQGEPPSDPQVGCSAEAAKSCETEHDEWLAAMNYCCCPTGQTCDVEHGNACVHTCIGPSDCTSSPYGRACVPVTNYAEDNVWDFVSICKPADGAAWHGCSSLPACVSGYDCWKDSWGNRTCVRSCNVDSSCNNDGVACCVKPPTATCDNSVQSCGGSGGCLPCL